MNIKHVIAKLTFVFISVIVLLTGLVILTSTWDINTTYHSNGRQVMDAPTWEAFKLAVAQSPEADVSSINYLDSGNTKLTYWTNLDVPANFPFGTLSKTMNKHASSSAFTLEVILLVAGTMGLIFSLPYALLT